MENLARMFNKELFVLDVPSSDTPESVQYLANQYKEGQTRFIGSRTGESLDEGKLREAIEKSNRARELMVKVTGSRRMSHPHPTDKALPISGLSWPCSSGRTRESR